VRATALRNKLVDRTIKTDATWVNWPEDDLRYMGNGRLADVIATTYAKEFSEPDEKEPEMSAESELRTLQTELDGLKWAMKRAPTQMKRDIAAKAVVRKEQQINAAWNKAADERNAAAYRARAPSVFESAANAVIGAVASVSDVVAPYEADDPEFTTAETEDDFPMPALRAIGKDTEKMESRLAALKVDTPASKQYGQLPRRAQTDVVSSIATMLFGQYDTVPPERTLQYGKLRSEYDALPDVWPARDVVSTIADKLTGQYQELPKAPPLPLEYGDLPAERALNYGKLRPEARFGETTTTVFERAEGEREAMFRTRAERATMDRGDLSDAFETPWGDDEEIPDPDKMPEVPGPLTGLNLKWFFSAYPGSAGSRLAHAYWHRKVVGKITPEEEDLYDDFIINGNVSKEDNDDARRKWALSWIDPRAADSWWNDAVDAGATVAKTIVKATNAVADTVSGAIDDAPFESTTTLVGSSKAKGKWGSKERKAERVAAARKIQAAHYKGKERGAKQDARIKAKKQTQSLERYKDNVNKMDFVGTGNV
jgi:hypothetical protein